MHDIILSQILSTTFFSFAGKLLINIALVAPKRNIQAMGGIKHVNKKGNHCHHRAERDKAKEQSHPLEYL